MKARHLITLVLAATIAAGAAGTQSFAALDHNNGGKQDDKGNQQGSQKDEKQDSKQEDKQEEKKDDDKSAGSKKEDAAATNGDKGKQDHKYERSSGAPAARDHNGGGKGKQDSRF